MNKKTRSLLVFAILFSFVGISFFSCQSAPEEPEEEAPEEEDAAAQEESTSGAAYELSPEEKEELDGLKTTAANKISRAEEAKAEDYAPDLLSAAKEAYQTANSERTEDPTGAKTNYETAIEKADAAFEKAYQGLKASYQQQYDRYVSSLQDSEADKYYPGEYRKTTAAAQEALDLFEEDDPSAAMRKSQEAFYNLQEFRKKVDEKLRWAAILERDTEFHLAQAGEAEAYRWAPEVLQESSQLLAEGLTSQREYDLDTAVSKLERAKYLAMAAYRYASKKQQVETTDKKLYSLMERMEKASRMKAITEDGEVIDPDPWNGDSEIPELPQPELELEDKEDAPSEPKSDPENDAGEEDSVSRTIPIQTGKTAVLGDEQEDDAEEEATDKDIGARGLLNQAKTLWKKGVEARADSDLEMADEYFSQAEVYLSAYENMAVSDVYTVQARTENHDCLWRIAGFESIYDDPFLWPRIWRRNRKMIQNPDLIYPGWTLLIPPKN